MLFSSESVAFLSLPEKLDTTQLVCKCSISCKK